MWANQSGISPPFLRPPPCFFHLRKSASSSCLPAPYLTKASNMPGPLLIGLGVAAAAFFGRAGYVALRKSRGAITQAGALGKAFYKGGFEPKMNRREASLILEIKYVYCRFES